MLEWLEPEYPDGFDPEAFDLDFVNEQLADGIEGLRADFEGMDEDEDLEALDPVEEDQGDDEDLDASDNNHATKPSNIIKFPKR